MVQVLYLARCADFTSCTRPCAVYGATLYHAMTHTKASGLADMFPSPKGRYMACVNVMFDYERFCFADRNVHLWAIAPMRKYTRNINSYVHLLTAYTISLHTLQTSNSIACSCCAAMSRNVALLPLSCQEVAKCGQRP